MWPFKRMHPAPKTVEPAWSGTNLYLMQSGGLYKIGISNDPERRRRELQNQSGRATTIVCTWWAERPEDVEAALHRHFGAKRQYGEWFRLTAEDAYALGYVLGGTRS